MAIIINHNILSDSPYNSDNENYFAFQQDDIDDIVQDIYNGQPTCYLISGYRGAGKTSFIKKVEFDLQNINNSKNVNNDPNFKHTIFVYTNFSRYESQTFLLRKLIRGLYFSLTCDKNAKLLEVVEEKDKGKKNDEKISTIIKTLFLRTFHDISSSQSLSNEEKKVFNFKIDFSKLFKILIN